MDRSRFTLVFITLLFPLELLAQPQVEWVWTGEDTVTSEGYGIELLPDGSPVCVIDGIITKLSAGGFANWSSNLLVNTASGVVVLENGNIMLATKGTHSNGWTSNFWTISQEGNVLDTVTSESISGEPHHITHLMPLASRIVVRYLDDNDGTQASFFELNRDGEFLEDHFRWWQDECQDIFIANSVVENSLGELVFVGQRQCFEWGLNLAVGNTETAFIIPNYDAETHVYRPLIIGSNNGEYLCPIELHNAYGESTTSALRVYRFSAVFDTLWGRDVVGPPYTCTNLAGAKRMADGTILIAASISDTGAWEPRLRLIRADEEANILWQSDFEFDEEFDALALALDNFGYAFVLGRTSFEDSYWRGFAMAVKIGPLESLNVGSTIGLPSAFLLHPNFPNPFNPTTEISFGLDKATLASLKVYDILGREVATLADGLLEAGTHRVTFDGTGLASGVYIYRLESGRFSQSRKMVLLK